MERAWRVRTASTRQETMKAFLATLLAAGAFAYAAASPFWDYVNKPDPAYAWRDTGFRYREKGMPLVRMCSAAATSRRGSCRMDWLYAQPDFPNMAVPC